MSTAALVGFGLTVIGLVILLFTGVHGLLSVDDGNGAAGERP